MTAPRGPFSQFLFDCDSTLARIEGVDELPGGTAELKELTDLAMSGRVPLEQVYGARLRILAPSAQDLERIGRLYVERATEDAGEVVAALHELGKEVHVVSGGFRPAVLALARSLGIPEGRVHAVDVSFGPAGEYAGFDETSPLSRNGGKARIAALLRAEGTRSVLVGDGTTDLEAEGSVDLFVGFGGVVRRPEVERAAAVYVRSASLAPLLEVTLTADERSRLAASARFARLLRKAEALVAGERK